jgi:Mn-containing catalase
VQSFHVENAGIRDMLQDIAIEEFSHLEMVGKLIAQHTSKLDQTSIHDAPLFKIKGGGPHFLDSQGSCWTAAYIQEGGNVVRDLRANISAEAGPRQTYESPIKSVRHPPDETVKLVFNLSQGEDERRSWNEEPDFEYVDNPEPEGGFPPDPVNPDDEGHKPSPVRPGVPKQELEPSMQRRVAPTESATLQNFRSAAGGYIFLWSSMFAISR